MYEILEHPEIGCCLRTGHPSWMQEVEDREEFDEDAAYEDRRDEHGW